MLVKYNIHGYEGKFVASNIAIAECYSMKYDKERETVTLLLHGNSRIFMKSVSEETYVFLMKKLWEDEKLNLTVLNLKYDVYFNPNDIKYRAAY